MPSLNERYRQILQQPLDYLHPHRLQLPGGFDSEPLRRALEPLLVQGLGLPGADDLPELAAPWSALWIRHWDKLPTVASLMGTYLQLAQLAPGAALARLTAGERRFAACALGERAALPVGSCLPSELSRAAQGLGILLGWRSRVPEPLLQALPLQFSPAQALAASELPSKVAHSRLFLMAVQHARFHPQSR